jgi:hypothetical protein
VNLLGVRRCLRLSSVLSDNIQLLFLPNNLILSYYISLNLCERNDSVVRSDLKVFNTQPVHMRVC